MNRYKEFFKYARKLGISDEDRAELVRNHTDGRTASLRELSDKELAYITEHIALQHELRIRSERSVVLSIIQKMIGKQVSRYDWWTEVNRICQDPRVAGKPFRELTIAELNQVAIKLRVIARKQASVATEPTPQKKEPVIMCRLPLKYS